MNPKNEEIPFIMLSERKKNRPLYLQIYTAIRKAILSGEFSSGKRLPSSRLLAKNLDVSRITIVNAYEQLYAEGYLEGKTGAGTFVAAKLPEDLLETGKKKLSEKIKSEKSVKRLPKLSPFGEKMRNVGVEKLQRQTLSNVQPFQNGLTAVEEFPFEIWSRIAGKLYRNPPRSLLNYGDSQGFRPLREALAKHLKSSRSVNCTPEQIIITSGAQQALDLSARIFLSEKDAFVIENPCYLEARNSFLATNATEQRADVDKEGLSLEKVNFLEKRPKIVYVTPSHQYPLGVTMSLSRRLELLKWAEENEAWIIEDDYNSEYRYSGRPLASLQGLDETGKVIYIGTFSKTIFPSLRLGCVVVPEELVEVYTAARAFNDVHSSPINQAILAEFIAEGHFSRHLRRMRQLYEKRQKILVEECRKHLKNLLTIEQAEAGMHLIGWLAEGLKEKEIIAEAGKENLTLSGVSSYYLNENARQGLIFGYTAFDERQIKEGVEKLKKVLKR